MNLDSQTDAVKTIFTYIDRFGQEWVIFDHFLRQFLGLSESMYHRYKKAISQMPEFDSHIRSDYLAKYDSLDVTGNFARQFHGYRFIIDIDFFVNKFFTKKIIKKSLTALGINSSSQSKESLKSDIEKNLYFAKKFVEKFILPKSVDTTNQNAVNQNIGSDAISTSLNQYLCELGYSRQLATAKPSAIADGLQEPWLIRGHMATCGVVRSEG